MTLVENRDNMITNFNFSVNGNSLTERRLFRSQNVLIHIPIYVLCILIKEIRKDSHLISKNINKHFGSPNNGYCICKVLIAQCTLHYNSVVL